MSTELQPVSDTLLLTRFSGGQQRGTCVQLTQLSALHRDTYVGYVQLTRDEARATAQALLAFADGVEKEADPNDPRL